MHPLIGTFEKSARFLPPLRQGHFHCRKHVSLSDSKNVPTSGCTPGKSGSKQIKSKSSRHSLTLTNRLVAAPLLPEQTDRENTLLSVAAADQSERDQAPQVACQNVHKYFGGRHVLCGIDLVVPRGTSLGIIGHTGAGKTTLIKCMIGLMKPTQGQVTTLGKDPWLLHADEKKRIGYVPQHPQLVPWMQVEQLVAYTSAFYKSWDKAWADNWLSFLGLRRGQRVASLSAADRQKVGLLLAIGHQPNLLIMDEPLSRLDGEVRSELLKRLLEFAGDKHHTVIISSQIVSGLEPIVTHIAEVVEGSVADYRATGNQPVPDAP